VIEVAPLIIGVLALIASSVSAVVAYLGWRDRTRSPRLRVGFTDWQDRSQRILDVVDNGDRRQIVFTLTLYNDGPREARHWGLWLASLDPYTMFMLDNGRDSSRTVQNDLRLGNRWASELRAEAPADTIAPKGGVLALPSRHTLNFPGQPSAVSFDHRLSADGMPQSSGQFRIDINWTTRKAEVRKVS
jgi:hypothetical protein